MIAVAALRDAFHDDCLTKGSYVSGAERDRRKHPMVA